MAHFQTTVRSGLVLEQAFAYMAQFDNVRDWDPSVIQARPLAGEGPIGVGSSFVVAAEFLGRRNDLVYTVVEYVPPQRLVLEAPRPGFVSRDVITIDPDPDGGSLVTYDATLQFKGLYRLADPFMHRAFAKLGAAAEQGLERALNAAPAPEPTGEPGPR